MATTFLPIGLFGPLNPIGLGGIMFEFFFIFNHNITSIIVNSTSSPFYINSKGYL
ncbi:hypothetical protein [Proteus mirabilis]|uniref:hypothetical protein n=1 Tax=Proteus mirabilis TaxID=584 RepID=UPI0034DD6001